MKALALFWLALSTSFASADRGSFDLGVGAGYHSNYGTLGVGGRYFISPTQDIHMSMGIEDFGFLTGGGTRWYRPLTTRECLLFFSCEPHYFAGATALATAGGALKITTGGMSGTYRLSPALAAHLTTGLFTVFRSNFTIGLEAGFRYWFMTPTVHFESGTYDEKQKDDVKNLFSPSVSLAATFGCSF